MASGRFGTCSTLSAHCWLGLEHKQQAGGFGRSPINSLPVEFFIKCLNNRIFSVELGTWNFYAGSHTHSRSQFKTGWTSFNTGNQPCVMSQRAQNDSTISDIVLFFLPLFFFQLIPSIVQLKMNSTRHEQASTWAFCSQIVKVFFFLSQHKQWL